MTWQTEEGNKATILNGRLKGQFVSKNFANLSIQKLFYYEISLLSKGLRFIPTSNTIMANLKILTLKCALFFFFFLNIPFSFHYFFSLFD